MDKELLAKAKKEAEKRGKEAFNYAKFVQHYVHDTGSCERLTGDEPKSVQDQYEEMYYTYKQFEHIMTVEAFADFLNTIDESY